MEKETKNKVLILRISEEEKKEVEKASKNKGVSMARFARLALKDFMKKGELR